MASGKREESIILRARLQNNPILWVRNQQFEEKKSLRLSSKHTLFVHNEKDVFYLM